MKHGADIDAQDVRGDMPLDFAKHTGNPNSFLKAGTSPILELQNITKYIDTLTTNLPVNDNKMGLHVLCGV